MIMIQLITRYFLKLYFTINDIPSIILTFTFAYAIEQQNI